MKATVGALMMSTSAIVLGLVVAAEASLLTFATVQGGISADTPVDGLTVGLLVIGGMAALVAAFKGAKSLVMFTLACGKWVDTMNETVEKVAAHQKELDALQRWRVTVADPSFVRAGIGKPNPVGDLADAYKEAAG